MSELKHYVGCEKRDGYWHVHVDGTEIQAFKKRSEAESFARGVLAGLDY